MNNGMEKYCPKELLKVESAFSLLLIFVFLFLKC